MLNSETLVSNTFNVQLKLSTTKTVVLVLLTNINPSLEALQTPLTSWFA